MSRTANSIKNIKYALIGQLIGLVIIFISRIIFVNILGAEYLGINGLFTNILAVLSLAEMGIGTAIVYSMYKPIAEDDIEKIKSLMDLFRKTYIAIGVIISVLGIMITPFLNYFIKEMPNVDFINLIFLMFVFNTSISYFYSYKRFLIIANQKKYIATIYRYSAFIGMNIFQVIILITTHNYILFLSIELLATFLENFFISKKADQMYPYLKEKDIAILEKSEKEQIKKNVQALIFHRIGGVIVLGTDNLLISMMIGIVAVGIYSNYLLIISSLMMIYSLIFESLTASVGNLGITQNKERNLSVFYTTNFSAFWIFGFSSIALWNLVNPFIKIWLGSEYLFDINVVTVLIINFYLTGMRTSIRVFKDAHGLYWYDRYKPLAESAINLGCSITLANYFGVFGIFVGTMISTITTSFWVEPFVTYKYGFNASSKSYFKLYFKYALVTVSAGAITGGLCSIFNADGVLNFLAKTIICMIIPNVIFFLIFMKSPEFNDLKRIIRIELIEKVGSVVTRKK